jgi:hypothetical protein
LKQRLCWDRTADQQRQHQQTNTATTHGLKTCS